MYHYFDAAVLRAPAWPPGQQVDSWPDLTGPRAGRESWRTWLTSVWELPGFAAAVEQASPDLARRVREVCGGRQLPDPVVRRAVLAVMRYLLRASGRATPFGLFAGVAPICISADGDVPTVRVGEAHRPVARVTAEWLSAVLRRLEGDGVLLRRLMVVANNLAFERDGHLVLEHRASAVVGGAPEHVSVRLTGPVRAAIRLASQPVSVVELVDRLSADAPHTPEGAVDKLVAELVAERFLLTSLRPSITGSDPLGHLVRELEAADAENIGDVAETVKGLRAIKEELDEHYRAPAAAGDHLARAADVMADLHRISRPPLAIDLRLGWEVTIPATVAAEAATAAASLVRLARRPALNTGWIAWHDRFLDRYGPRALVPVLDAVDAGIGLGYPAGYDGMGSAAGAVTDRDRKLLALACNAATRRQCEIVLDDGMIDDLTVVAADAPVQPTTELTVRIDATTAQALADGHFTLAVTGVSRAAGTTTGRFLDLFDGRMRTSYPNLPTGTRGALAVQVSASVPYTNTENVARVPQILDHVLPVGDYPGAHSVVLDDIAVTADLHGIYLVSLSRRRVVEPVILNAVNPNQYMHPLARFLLEASHALRVPCAGFDWGTASALPFLPALRYGRTIISPARWRLTATDLPGSSASWREWESALTRWQDRVALPRLISVGEGDQRIRLDLFEPAHRALLRAQVERLGTAVLQAAPTSEAAGWFGGHPHEIVIPLAASRQAEPPRLSTEVTTRDHGHLPGQGGRLSLKLYGHPDRHDAILTRHLPRLIERLGSQSRWWFLRYQDPHHHLRLRLTVPIDAFAATVTQVTTWSEELRRAGLMAHVQWDTYFPETARFGGRAAMAAAEAFFAADSAAALAQLRTVMSTDGPRLHALTAASMLDLAIAFLGDAATAMSWLIDHARTDASAPDRALYDQALSLASPYERSALAAQPLGEHVLSCWTLRRKTLTAYRSALSKAGSLPAAVLPDLLHLHHVRMAGTSLTSERACLHLARAAALSWTARTRSTP